MLDVFNSLTWQFQVLIGEAILSAFLGMYLIQRGLPRRTLAYTVTMIAWDVVVFVLFFTGGATTSWQHIIYGICYLWTLCSAVINYGKPYSETERAATKTNYGTALFAALLATFLIYLLVAGR